MKHLYLHTAQEKQDYTEKLITSLTTMMSSFEPNPDTECGAAQYLKNALRMQILLGSKDTFFNVEFFGNQDLGITCAIYDYRADMQDTSFYWSMPSVTYPEALASAITRVFEGTRRDIARAKEKGKRYKKIFDNLNAWNFEKSVQDKLAKHNLQFTEEEITYYIQLGEDFSKNHYAAYSKEIEKRCK